MSSSSSSSPTETTTTSHHAIQPPPLHHGNNGCTTGTMGGPSYYVSSLPYMCASFDHDSPYYHFQSPPFEIFNNENANDCSIMWPKINKINIVLFDSLMVPSRGSFFLCFCIFRREKSSLWHIHCVVSLDFLGAHFVAFTTPTLKYAQPYLILIFWIKL